MNKKRIFVIVGSASSHSSNHTLAEYIIREMYNTFEFVQWDDLRTLPHFNPEESINNPPDVVREFRNAIDESDAVLICTPEYIMSIPSGLKNAFEWCVATTVFYNKPVGLITASAGGTHAHAELQLIATTVSATCIPEATLLISGIKGKIHQHGVITHAETEQVVQSFIHSFTEFVLSQGTK